jgi:hypothetical protein
MKEKATVQSVTLGLFVMVLLALGLCGGLAMLDTTDPVTSRSPMVTVNDFGLAQPAESITPVETNSHPNSPSQDDATDIRIALGLSRIDAGYLVLTASSDKLRHAGLRTGDIITAINNRIVGDPSADMRILQSTRESGEAELMVIRGSERLFMSMSLE